MADIDPKGYMPRPGAPEPVPVVVDEGTPYVAPPDPLLRQMCTGCGAELKAEQGETLPEQCPACESGETAAQRAIDLKNRREAAIANLGPDGLPK